MVSLCQGRAGVLNTAPTRYDSHVAQPQYAVNVFAADAVDAGALAASLGVPRALAAALVAALQEPNDSHTRVAAKELEKRLTILQQDLNLTAAQVIPLSRPKPSEV